MDIKAEPGLLYLKARERFTQQEIADFLGRDVRTVKRWEVKEDGPPTYAVHGLQQMLFTREPQNSEPDFTFIDLFAGIGGLRMGFETHGGKCVFTSEWDSYSQKTYLANHAVDHDIIGDITPYIKEHAVPDHDVLLAGFPCQPFSIAGVSKKNSLGRKHGFECEKQGNLFFDIAKIIQQKKPKAFLLENVKNLVSHDKGNTFRVIQQTLTEELGYNIHFKVIDAKGFVPQHRERIFIVGFREDTEFTWDALELPDKTSRILKDILHPQDGTEEPDEPYIEGKKGKINPKYVLSDKLWNYLQAYAEKHRKAGNGFGFGKVTPNATARTLSARYYKDGSEILVSRGRYNPRRLTPRECARLMGYETSERRFEIPVSDTRAYQQFGNGVVVPVVEEVARIMKPHIINLVENDAEENAAKQMGLLA